ncbi:hypothetical protein J7E93_21805 [Streptomyces sp. ISL-36]|uniref:hypothetical protein n=1 Tax=Streptomyces sp. ISL-36 TaxID=2819182 RepID=UPI001BE63801|nr:hypothetical protein [Streptomyces sp. ISL-36]MBT2442694.1 hypothetical protein [Streptomyces sp. ISL-36]
MIRPVVVLADQHDTGATAVVSALTGHGGPDRVTVVRPHELARARWQHRVDAKGATTTRIVLPDGGVLDDRNIGAVLHRMPYVPPMGFLAAQVKDRHYATAELHALVASWLHGIASRVVGPVMTCPAPAAQMSESIVHFHAWQCGLPVVRRSSATRAGLLDPTVTGERLVALIDWPGGSSARVPLMKLPEEPRSEARRLLIAGDRVIGAGAEEYGDACRRLAARLGTTLAEAHMVTVGDRPALARVDLYPRLDMPSHADAAADLLLTVEARSRAVSIR